MERYRVEVPDDAYWRRQINCQSACPVHTDARGYVCGVAEGRFEDAYLIARGPNPLASICGAPCEAACRRGTIDDAVSIRALKRFLTDRYGRHAPQPRWSPRELIGRMLEFASERLCLGAEELSGFASFLDRQGRPTNATGEKIAIIGSGPAGLAAAHDLALFGFRPTVYEMESVPAGMLAVGIPEYRLPRDLIAAEVEFIRALGVEFVCNTQVGRDVTLAELRREHRAVVIAIGLKRSRTLPIPGTAGPGVLGGVEYLREVALGHPVALRKRVVVIGGGNVAYDVARTVVRQTGIDVSRTALRAAGVREVHLCSLESLEELPADDLEIIEGDEEGVVRHHGLGPKEILRNESGEVTGVVFERCTRVFNAEGRFAPEFDHADLTTIPADMVIWSIGQQPDLSFIAADGHLKLTGRGLLECNAETCETTAADVFVAGDIAYGPRLLIDAVASGKKVARRIYWSLRGAELVDEWQLVHLEIPEYRREPDYEKLRRTPIPSRGAAERTASQQTIVEVGYDADAAVREGCCCLDCGVNTIFDSEKCILCGGCADVCPELCLELVSLNRLDGDDSLRQAIADQLGDADLADGSAIIKDETKCIRCALCAQRCPVGAITMEWVQFSGCWNSATTDPATFAGAAT